MAHSIPTGFSSDLRKRIPKLKMLLSGSQQRLRSLGLPGINLGVPDLEVVASDIATAADASTVYRADDSVHALRRRVADAAQVAMAFRTPAGEDPAAEPSVSPQAMKNADEIVGLLEAAQAATSEFAEAVHREAFPPNPEGGPVASGR